MKKFNLISLGFGMIAGILVERYATGENVSKAKQAIKDAYEKTASKIDDIFDPKPSSTVEYVDEDLMTKSMDIPDDTPDDSDILFISPIKIFSLSAAHSILGEILWEFEHNRAITISDILSWIKRFDYDYNYRDQYINEYEITYKDKVKEYGWVDPSDFEITWNQLHKCYYLTTVAPVRIHQETKENNNDTEQSTNTPDTGSVEDPEKL